MLENIKPTIEFFCISNNKLWFVCNGYNILGAIDYDTFEISWYVIPYVDKVEEFYTGVFYTGIVCINNKLYIVPGSAATIAVFDIDNQKFNRIENKKHQIYKGNNWKYCWKYRSICVPVPARLRMNSE